MGQGPSAAPAVDVGIPGRNEDGFSHESDDNKTRIVSEVGGGLMSGVSRMLHPSSTRLILGSGGAGGNGRDGPDGWVDATVSTPLFPHGRPTGVERQARHQKRVSKFRVFADGVVFEGPDAMAIGDTHDLSRGYERLLGRPITRVTVGDKRAQQVLVAWADGRFWAVPSRQSFSRHLGVCLILGDKSARGPKHTLRTGDILRLGSVGLLVSEICTEADGGHGQVVTQEVLDQIREEIHTAPRQVLAPLRKEFEGAMGLGEVEVEEEEEEAEGASQGVGRDGEDRSDDDDEDAVDDDTKTEHSISSAGSGGGAGAATDQRQVPGFGEEDGNCGYQCYICMDSEEEDGDVLIAPCQCKGSTALVHVKCLQRLLSTGDSAKKTSVISTKHHNHTCKICKARYKTHVKLPDGTLVPLLNPSLVPPYITLVVITRHESHPDLFNTIFQLSFAKAQELSLGRSQGCDVVIGYRTVSTRHATISYSKGEFHYQDARSSNGSLLYLRGPLEVPTNRAIRLRMGRSILSLRARHSLQLSALPRKAMSDAWRWLSTSVKTSVKTGSGGGGGGGGGGDGHNNSSSNRRGGGSGGGDGSADTFVLGGASGGGEGGDLHHGPHAGLELLRDLHMGRYQDNQGRRDESSLVSREGYSGASGDRGLLWHLDSSSSSIFDLEASGRSSGDGSMPAAAAARRRRQQQEGGGEGEREGALSRRQGFGDREGTVWSTRENLLLVGTGARGGGGGGPGGGEGETKSSSSAAERAVGEAEEGDASSSSRRDDADLDSSALPPSQPSLAQSDIISAPPDHAIFQRTRSSRV